MTFNLSRRSLLGIGAGLGVGIGLAGCETGPQPSGNTVTAPSNIDEVRPGYFPYDGPAPDLKGDAAAGVPDGYLTFPDPPATTGQVPLGLSAPVEFLVQGRAPGTPSGRNEWWKKWQADLGTEFSVLALDSTQYTAKFQTSIAGDLLGDLTQFVSVPQLPKVLESAFTDLTPVLSGDNIKKYPHLANIPSAAWDMCMIGGKVWGVTNPRIVAGSVLMTQGDLLEPKGIDILPDLADGEAFLDLCREVTDPATGTFAIGQQPHLWTVPLVLESLGGTNGWKVDGGTWTSAYEDPAFERALEIVTTMWSEKLIHPNSYSDLSSTATWFDGGTTALFAQNIASWQNRAASAPFPVGVAVMPKWDGGGKAPKHLGVPGYNAPVGIKKMDDENRIDELLRVMDYIASPFGTEEYLTVNYGVKDRQWRIVDGQVVLDQDQFTTERFTGPAYAGSMANVSLYTPGSSDATEMIFKYLQQVIPTGVRNPEYGKFSDTNVSKGANALRNLNDLMANIIQGRAKLSEWADGVKAWKADAGDAIAREYEEQ